MASELAWGWAWELVLESAWELVLGWELILGRELALELVRC
jgi:hypothetical protein